MGSRAAASVWGGAAVGQGTSVRSAAFLNTSSDGMGSCGASDATDPESDALSTLYRSSGAWKEMDLAAGLDVVVVVGARPLEPPVAEPSWPGLTMWMSAGIWKDGRLSWDSSSSGPDDCGDGALLAGGGRIISDRTPDPPTSLVAVRGAPEPIVLPGRAMFVLLLFCCVLGPRTHLGTGSEWASAG